MNGQLCIIINMSQPNPAINYGVQNTIGVVPGSSLDSIVERNWAQLTDQQGDSISLVHVVPEGSTLDGKACYVEFVCTAKNEDASTIELTDKLALEHGAGALLISDITVQVGSQTETHIVRNDIARYTVDVFAGEQKRVALGGVNYYADRDAGVLSESNPSFKSSQKEIIEGKQFKLVHWLDHLPQFGQADPHIPGPVTITLSLQFSLNFSRLFKALTTSPVLTTTPNLYITKARFHFRTSSVETNAIEFISQAIGSPQGLTYNTVLNKTASIEPGIQAGVSQYNTSSVQTVIPTDEVLRQISLIMVDSVRTDLSVPYLRTRWNLLKSATLQSETGGSLRQWRELTAGKAPVFAELGARALMPMAGSGGSPQYPFNYWSFNQLNIADTDEGVLYAYLTAWFDDETSIAQARFKRLHFDLVFLGTTTNVEVYVFTSTHKNVRISIA